MPRKKQKPTSVPVTFRMDEDIFKRLNKYCKGTVLSRSRVINAALEHFTTLPRGDIIDIVMDYGAGKKK